MREGWLLMEWWRLYQVDSGGIRTCLLFSFHSTPKLSCWHTLAQIGYYSYCLSLLSFLGQSKSVCYRRLALTLCSQVVLAWIRKEWESMLALRVWVQDKYAK